MPDEILSNQVQTVQSAAVGVAEDPGTEAIAGNQTVQPIGQEGNTGEEKLGTETNLPPELEETRKQLLRDWHDKNQKLAEQKRGFEAEKESLGKEASMLKNLFAQEWFKKAMATEKSRREGRIADNPLSDEEFQAVKENPVAMDEYITRKARAIAESMYGSKLSEQEGAIKEIKLRDEFKACAKEFSDFKELKDKGVLDQYLADDRLTYEEAYRLYKHKTASSNDVERIQQEAEKILSARKAGSVEKSGVPRLNGARIVEAKNADDAFDKAWDEMTQGREVQVVQKK